MRYRIRTAACAWVATALSSLGLHAQSITQRAKIVVPNPSDMESLGHSVAIDGDWLVVGAPADDVDGFHRGSLRVYARNGANWAFHSKLVASDREDSDFFGWSVALDGTTLVVGAFLDSANFDSEGSAYVFTLSGNTWTQQAKLAPSSSNDVARFGSAVDIDGDTIVVGSPLLESGPLRPGGVFVYVRNAGAWTEQALVTAPTPGHFADFGASVGISGDRIVVGAPAFAAIGVAQSAVYVFERAAGVWSIADTLQPTPPLQGLPEFGTSVAIGVFLDPP